MQKRLFVVLLILVIQIFMVVTLFKHFPVRFAGFWAGLGFNLIGLTLFLMGFQYAPWKKTITFRVNIFYWLLGALPLWITSMSGASREMIRIPVGEEQVFFTLGQLLHPLSSAFYLALIVATLLDMVLQYRRDRSANKKA